MHNRVLPIPHFYCKCQRLVISVLRLTNERFRLKNVLCLISRNWIKVVYLHEHMINDSFGSPRPLQEIVQMQLIAPISRVARTWSVVEPQWPSQQTHARTLQLRRPERRFRLRLFRDPRLQQRTAESAVVAVFVVILRFEIPHLDVLVISIVFHLLRQFVAVL